MGIEILRHHRVGNSTVNSSLKMDGANQSVELLLSFMLLNNKMNEPFIFFVLIGILFLKLKEALLEEFFHF